MPNDIQADAFGAYLLGVQQSINSGSFQPALEQCIGIAHEAIAANFDGSREGSGTTWPPRKHEYAWPILIKTGDLKRSATSGGAKGNVQTIGPREATTGTTIPYAGFHDKGTKKMAARPFIDVSGAAIDTMEDVIGDYILKTFFGA